MQKQSITFSDKFQVVALIINIGVIVGLAIWNIQQEERLAKLEYNELAPRIAVYREVMLDLKSYSATYNWIIRNNGRTAAQNIVVSIFSNAEFPFQDCGLGIPFDNSGKRVVNNYILFESLTLPPGGTISVACSTKSGVVMSFMEKHKVFPNTVPSMNCFQQAASYDSEILFLLPNLGITANNVDSSRIYCVEELRDAYE